MHRVWRKSVLALALLVAVLVVVGAAYQAIATARDVARFPMPGQRVDVGGRALHLYCVGDGPTTVLLENGLGGVYPAWRLVQSRIARFARACSYDRAGFGWSDPVSSESIRARSVAEDLARLVGAAGLSPPFVLVGWSAGGVYVRRYYHDHPDGVIGMVLVDSSHEQQAGRFDEPNGARNRRDAVLQLNLCRTLAWSGIVRASNVMETMAAPLELPTELRNEFVAMENRTSYCAAELKEFVGFRADISQRERPASLGDLPLVVISRGRRITAGDAPDVSVARLDALDLSWSALQRELASLSTRSSYRIAERSGHAIPLQAPETVVTAVHDIITGQI